MALDRGTDAAVDDATLARLVRELADAVIIANADGEIVEWNEAATTMFGWARHEALGQTLDIIIPERFRDRHWKGYETAMATGRSVYASRLLEVPALHRDNTSLSIAFTVTIVHDRGGAVAGIAAVIRDETERRREMQRLRAAQNTN